MIGLLHPSDPNWMLIKARDGWGWRGEGGLAGREAGINGMGSSSGRGSTLGSNVAENPIRWKMNVSWPIDCFWISNGAYPSIGSLLCWQSKQTNRGGVASSTHTHTHTHTRTHMHTIKSTRWPEEEDEDEEEFRVRKLKRPTPPPPPPPPSAPPPKQTIGNI